MTGKAVRMSPKGDNAASDALPATVEELSAALAAIFEDARQRAVYLVDAYAHAAGEACESIHIAERQLRAIKPAGESAECTTVHITEREARDIKTVKRLYWPRSDLYTLAWNAMVAFHAERRRRPGTRELLRRMQALDSDHRPVLLRLERETIHWIDDASRANSFLRQMPEMLLCALVERDDERVAEIHARRDNADRALRDIECSGRLIDAYRKMAGKVGRDLGEYWGIPSDADFLSQWPSFLTQGLLGNSEARRETERAEPREGGVAIPVMLDGASPFLDGPAVSEMPSAIQFPSFEIKHYP